MTQPEKAVTQWLGSLTADRAVRAPGLFGHHLVAADWRIGYARGLPEHLVYFLVSGECAGEGGGRRWHLGPGGAVWIRPSVPFTMRALGRRSTAVYRFRLTPDPVADACLGPVLVLREAWELRSLMDLLVAELGSALPYREERIRGVLLAIFATVFRATDSEGEAGRLPTATRARIEEYVDTRIAERPTAAELAAVAELSPDYFTRVFRRTYGVPPRTWLLRRRIQHAAIRLDERDEPLGRVAAAYGYPDAFLFSRQFKAVMGVSPRTYRTR